jgi:hypothetical protein
MIRTVSLRSRQEWREWAGMPEVAGRGVWVPRKTTGLSAPTGREPYRITQAGYDFLMKRTRLSTKTIQRIVDRLIDKGFIDIHEPADIYHRTSTVPRLQLPRGA